MVENQVENYLLMTLHSDKKKLKTSLSNKILFVKLHVSQKMQSQNLQVKCLVWICKIKYEGLFFQILCLNRELFECLLNLLWPWGPSCAGKYRISMSFWSGNFNLIWELTTWVITQKQKYNFLLRLIIRKQIIHWISIWM